MAKDLFLEIGCEEIPAGFVPKAMADMELLIKKEFDSARIEYGEVVTLGTPRRLVLAVKGVAERQPDAELTAMGPAKSHAYDADGNPTKAAQGFARGQGIDVSQLKLVTTEKGEYLAAVKSEIGRETAELLPEILPRLIGNIPFKKSMRWADFEVRFARPIHWIAALFDGKVVPFSFGNIESGSASRGHRFMANTSFPVRDLAHYLEECERHFVIPDPNKRKALIRAEIERVAKPAKGNERVLRARLSDARFFFDEDHKVRLEARVESLKSVVYQAKLGTSYEKMERFRELSKRLAQRLNPSVTKEVERAATLCKADLVSGMVGEFPEVQGIMGREYALHDGENAAVANAIAEHYLPTQAGGELPASDIGAFVSLADKMDTICGCFCVGLIPTGSADPYALRRSALGIINIILEKGYREPLSEFVKASLDLLAAKATRPLAEVNKDVLDFFRGRFVNLMADRFPSDAVEAVVSVSFDDLVEAAAKIEALAGFRSRDDFGPLAVAFKRVCNIVKDGVDTPVSAELFQDAAEGELHQALTQVSGKVADALQKADYLAALTEIATLKPAVDLFFEKVMVMAEDERVRRNRLALLTGIARLFGSLADFSRLSP